MRAGDLAYFDPPYLPISKTSSFTAYTSENFRLADHERLRDLAMELARRNVRVVLSNSTAPAIEELYQEEDQEGRTVFVIHRVQAERSINSKAPGRGKIGELVITTLGEEDA
jgi:DNA adenine methylase